MLLEQYFLCYFTVRASIIYYYHLNTYNKEVLHVLQTLLEAIRVPILKTHYAFLSQMIKVSVSM